ncbi:YjjG family noncanonical pyrimidine nucleotidase [Flavobacterium sp. GT3R68]|uniref:YjjG family noncanonical pyrimidine nucleotidase n=1 Tax=Flavobacterium sp. GT3R68 TaxID=2594437 RepID=UPI000F88635A|nr:YjjG family noncanonical pyrimidine nucleotidase [Flavobacterium sp. GT3R68]RTY88492.1 noncanonical pyrimidine nucleotidase, YjjG family [Flavobacterium sp. GSN2]TRW92592.1 noncanonical pyrimidine nucleotidase, YjjG family [Flavobacterium sp. GT3R68]
MKISDIFFDLDHTLWDFEKNSALAFEAIFKKHNIEVDLGLFLTHYVPINLKYWKLYRKELITHNQLRFDRLKVTFDAIKYEIEDEKVVFLSLEYIHYLPQFNHLLDGAIELLNYLQPKYKLHIITNGFDEIQKNKLDNSNISHYFQTVTNSEMVGVKKPNPIIFEYALKKAQAKKENSIMIGDCIEADVQGALEFGLDAILFKENGLQIDPDIKQVSHLLQLKNYL